MGANGTSHLDVVMVFHFGSEVHKERTNDHGNEHLVPSKTGIGSFSTSMTTRGHVL